jgi:4-amino-4-deoxy-L-arabinose transferase-like glycosyltransferase
MITVERDDMVGEGQPGRGGGFVPLLGRSWWLVSGLVLVLALAATVPTTGDLGLTWDEPAYRFSQLRSEQWWGRLFRARSVAQVRALVAPDALLFYWQYARYGINFHPPLAGQLSVLTHAVCGSWMKDIPSRRLASVLEYALTIALGFGFLARRYGATVGTVAAGALLFMPRVYGDAHLATTDPPGLLLWAATALACWKGLYEPGARRWRVLVGVLAGLAFVEKMGAVVVLAPVFAWLVVARLPRTFVRPGGRSDWVDGLVTSAAMLVPLGLALVEILRLATLLPKPFKTNLFVDHPATYLPGAILVVPVGVWVLRRLLGRFFPTSPVWGIERPALEIWTSVLAFGPLVGWLGNPAWWRETLPRLAHYYLINNDRRGALPDIQIYYLGQTYEYSLPWHNAWVLISVTVPAALLAAAVVGLLYSLRNARRDHLPVYFLIHLVTLPAARMLPTPAHDGVRLFLPTFFFLAALAGWGTGRAAVGLGRLVRARGRGAWAPGAIVAALVLVPSAWQLVKVHPFELSYYNELIGGPRGAWNAGFELTYWYDAFNDSTLAEVNKVLPRRATVDFLNDKTNPMVFLELQSLGQLRPDIVLGWRDPLPFPLVHVWLLTQDSKASAFTRLLFTMKPWYARRPDQLDGLRVATVANPAAVSRAWALSLLTDAGDDRPPDRPEVPGWVRRFAPFLGRLWGVGITKSARLNVYEPVFAWARDDPSRLRAAARALAASRGEPVDEPAARKLMTVLRRLKPRYPGLSARALLRARPEALPEAVEILIRRGDAVRAVLLRYGYTDPQTPALGGYLDEGLSGTTPAAASAGVPASRVARRQAAQAGASVATAIAPPIQ